MDIKEEQGEPERNESNENMAIVPVATHLCIAAQSPRITTGTRSTQSSPTLQSSPAINQARTLMPVNIKQISDAWEGRRASYIVINNTFASSIKVIGRVNIKKVDEYKGNFNIEDCTGSIDASIWFTSSRKELECIPPGAYAMVVGKLNLERQTPEIQCYVCRAITNFNDITHHHLSVIATHIDLVLQPERGVYDRVAEMWQEDNAKDSNLNAHLKGGNKSALMNEPNTPDERQKPVTCHAQSKGKNTASDDSLATIGLPTSDAIMTILRAEAPKTGPQGVHILRVCKMLMVDEQSIRPYMDDLASAGELYTTIDPDHFAPA